MSRDDDYEEDGEEMEQSRQGVGVGTFLAGLAIGAGLALLFAPQSGEELRRKIKKTARRAQDAAGELATDVKERAQDLAEDVRHRTEDLLDDAREEIESRVGEARHAIGKRRRQLTRAVEAGRGAARDARESFERRIAEARSQEPRSSD
jgi:gas vesicle protein